MTASVDGLDEAGTELEGGLKTWLSAVTSNHSPVIPEIFLRQQTESDSFQPDETMSSGFYLSCISTYSQTSHISIWT